MVFYLIAAIIVPFLGLHGLAGFLALSTISNHFIELPWYFSNLADYHGEFLAGVFALMARPRLARFGFWIPSAIGSAAFWYFVTQWGGRAYLPLPLLFLILAFSSSHFRTFGRMALVSRLPPLQWERRPIPSI
jgi:exopolysaccharide production protein ExoZ